MKRELTAIITAIGIGGRIDRRAVCPAPTRRGSVSAASSSSRTRTKEGGTTTVQGSGPAGLAR